MLRPRLQQLDEENGELRSCTPCLKANIERLGEVSCQPERGAGRAGRGTVWASRSADPEVSWASRQLSCTLCTCHLLGTGMGGDRFFKAGQPANGCNAGGELLLPKAGW